ncbi:hypothetical protein O181_114050, partial [Austropuccinia psidii MF-1]|nr:hypothetical protein [Austropuccinia psidii MF-1]
FFQINYFFIQISSLSVQPPLTALQQHLPSAQSSTTTITLPIPFHPPLILEPPTNAPGRFQALGLQKRSESIWNKFRRPPELIPN